MTAPTIHLRVKSPGGSVFAARAMEQAIREHPSRIVTHIDGVAASAATVLILPSDEIRIAPGSFVMIHQASAGAYGNAEDMLRAADLLEQADVSLVQSYAKRTGQSEEDLRAWMAAETWFGDARAVELGFADVIADDAAVQNTTAWNLAAYKHPPAELARPAPPAANRDALRRAALSRLIPA